MSLKQCLDADKNLHMCSFGGEQFQTMDLTNSQTKLTLQPKENLTSIQASDSDFSNHPRSTSDYFRSRSVVKSRKPLNI